MPKASLCARQHFDRRHISPSSRAGPDYKCFGRAFFARGKFEALNRSKRREPARDLGLALILSARLTENLFRPKIFPQEEKRVFCSDDTEGLRESDPRCSSGNRFS